MSFSDLHFTPNYSRTAIGVLQIRTYDKLLQCNPKVARLLVLPITLLSIAAPVVKRVAQVVEAVGMLVINLVGAFFSKKCSLHIALYSFRMIATAPIDLIFDVLNGIVSGIITVAAILITPKKYSALCKDNHLFLGHLNFQILYSDKPTTVLTYMYHFYTKIYRPTQQLLKKEISAEAWARKIYAPVKEKNSPIFDQLRLPIYAYLRDAARVGFHPIQFVEDLYNSVHNQHNARISDFFHLISFTADFKFFIRNKIRVFFEKEKPLSTVLDEVLLELQKFPKDKEYCHLEWYMELLLTSEKLQGCLSKGFDNSRLKDEGCRKILLNAAIEMAKFKTDNPADKNAILEIQQQTKERLSAQQGQV